METTEDESNALIEANMGSEIVATDCSMEVDAPRLVDENKDKTKNDNVGLNAENCVSETEDMTNDSFEEPVIENHVDEQENTTMDLAEAPRVENREGGGDGERVENSIEKELIPSSGGPILEPHEGMEFVTDDAAKIFYNAYARRAGFSIRISSTHRSTHDGTVVSRKFVCSKEGFREKKYVINEKRVKRPRAITREGCKAMIMIRKEKPEKWIITKFIRDHCHALESPSRVQYLRSHRSLTRTAQSLIDTYTGSGARSSVIMSFFDKETSGGFSNVGLPDRDIRNYIGTSRQMTLEKGDLEAILDYFKRMQAENPAFFYAIQVDEKENMTNCFWSDGRSRMSYNYFGDTVIFDTTYKMNQYRLPFVFFAGVNHHHQPVLFGCALILNESENSFTWLFDTWLKAMSGHHPISITTEQDQAIGAAVAQVFPRTRHRLCLWHILQEVPEKLSHICHAHGNFKDEFHKCIHTTKTIDDFESNWRLLIDSYDLRENQWVQSMYKMRDQWVPAYLRNTFFGEVSATQQSGSIKSFFDGFVNVDTTVQELLKNYAQALDGKFEEEIQADFESVHEEPALKTHLPMEKQAANIYTKMVFAKFQEEIMRSLAYTTERKEKDGASITYRVAKFEEEKRTYTVTLNVQEKRASCGCCFFEFSGILCRHILIVFRVENILTLPPHYILKRWTKNVKSGYSSDECGIEMRVDGQESLTLRYNDLCRRAIKIAEDGAITKYTYRVALGALEKAYAEVAIAKQNIEMFDQRGTPITRNIRQDNISESGSENSINQMTLHDPQQEKMKGRTLSSELKPCFESTPKHIRKCTICKSNGHDKRICPSLRGSAGVGCCTPTGLYFTSGPSDQNTHASVSGKRGISGIDGSIPIGL
ncbi:protein FAR1-RELATED SEQUENCE 5 isoform X1 [Amborella trichopoda]|uniref:protein FAR1-RELATED SEQUENCE 5 isoform X1 n=1 Tax=Amborella trichopoda TaxID=13333 RepID=UPI0005D358CC|nr:protein FAR1-RELATED SEQUENCE 5 isoform X1 [Amborella trichopoda]XP_020523064.1 protein FAR1-RELATED SEQUENCE 5 isoform X1 [Amborella trichopoda]XP_020523065.1 protein FAR1-RELATED SEQUENCE 5 isoform X1 [Amborella trichopoda]|eukprot:XP_011623480.1 protein FAR1-RELATED SEQUENCE 5 isoform X1 [Amborella trichopoda]